MNRKPSCPADDVSRRSVLAAGALGCSLSLSGCLGRAQRVVDRDADDHLSLSVVTVPADDDRAGVQIARHLESNLEAVGIDVTVAMRSRSEFLEAVLLDADFDLYVGRHPVDFDPDFLYETLHSTYASEAGWQNPFGFTNMAFDRLLEAQRTADGETRAQTVASILRSLARETPFEPICFPDEYRIARTDRVAGWGDHHPGTQLGYLGLEPVGAEPTVDLEDADADGSDGSVEPVPELSALVTDARPSQNLNPLSATVRQHGPILELLYDSLGTVDDGELHPWLARSWTWNADGSGDVGGTVETGGTDDVDESNATDGPEAPDGADAGTGTNGSVRTDSVNESNTTDGTEVPDGIDETVETVETVETAETSVTITLREDCRFHDGEPVTAADVAFTYRFLADTALGRAEVPSPAPRYCGPVSAVEDVRVEGTHRVTLFLSAGRDAGRRAFTVPILPAHVWRDRVADRIDPAGDATAPQGRWHVVTTDNIPPIGTGPYRFADRSEREHVTLERFDDHFTLRDDVALPGPSVAELRFEVDPGSASAIERVAAGDADATASILDAHTIADIPDGGSGDGSESDETTDSDESTGASPVIERFESPSRSFYHVGFNTRNAPLSNAHVRRAVAGLVDKAWLVEDAFDGHARPTATPVADEWAPADLEWNGTDPVTPFLGDDGELNVARARAAFEALGFRYDETEGRLLR